MEIKIKTKLLNTVFFVFIMTFSYLANAGLITETWQGTISKASDPTIYSLNDVLSWTVTYDNESLAMNFYSYGGDKLAGTEDDTVQDTIIESCPGVWCDNYNVLADADFELNHLFEPIHERMKTLGQTPLGEVNPYSSHNQHIIMPAYGGTFGHYNQHSQEFIFSSNNQFSYGNAYFHIQYGMLDMHQFYLTDIKLINAIQVPEPSTFFIFAVAIMGLAFRRAKK